ncbi:anaerobic ribonucleoside-triphosphate reductase activating protein [Facklamia sp. DSM 111018]|uniref:Anaerobic ribonucleoside-triphosphate reductase-activating protein n=1 Tax=Facklamia lactis TaxID=2749967 RepID=A0ABS0LSW1_9LACT|nr:anaerobic ribonucleoside-triphosphate reductase activating protein [Facklamia lactis]MBG9981276.1 anaerobic ribonucleoside-triphosphate reductase activating protein [Facklamia lactis]MBG9987247.1 anaerobic ribonucleoside-triphosphate reductase activating protein [Facklamia lactis]
MDSRRIIGPKNPMAKEWLAKDWSCNKVADYKPYNFVDGEGVRCSLYVSGCLFACPGCYNKKIQNFNYGIDYTEELENRIISDLSADYCQGLTLLGGEPMLNTTILIPLCQKVRKMYGADKDIWTWTGYTWEELLKESDDKKELLSLIDILVDGRYLQEKRNLSLRFRGSNNQRIIKVAESIEKGRVCLW